MADDLGLRLNRRVRRYLNRKEKLLKARKHAKILQYKAEFTEAKMALTGGDLGALRSLGEEI